MTAPTSNIGLSSAMEVSAETPSQRLNQEAQRWAQKFWSDYQTPRSTIADHHPGTCQWLLNKGDFLTWKDNSNNGSSNVLWISGNPGMGKTVLSKFLLGRFEEEAPNRSNTIYFFFNNQDEERNNAISFLKAAIYQFIIMAPGLLDTCVMPRAMFDGDELYTSFDRLWEIFYDMIQTSKLGRIYCVVDALDECDEASRSLLVKHIGQHLNSAGSPNNPGFKMVITSRPYNDIYESWGSFTIFHLRAEKEEDINQDIKRFVKDEVGQLAVRPGYTKPLIDRVKTALIEGADGMFLWVYLTITILKRTSPNEVEEKLNSTHGAIDAIYDRLFAEIPEGSRSTVLRILKWVVFATRDLTVTELQLAYDSDRAAHPSSHSHTDLEAVQEPWQDLNLCRPLLKVNNSVVYLVHPTAKEYIIQRSPEVLQIQRVPSPDRESSAHYDIACACLYCLSFYLPKLCTPERLEDFYVDRHTFLQYAVGCWLYHLRKSGQYNNDALRIITSRAIQGQSTDRLASLLPPSGFCLSNDYCLKFLDILLGQKLFRLAQIFVEIQPFDPDPPDAIPTAPLYTASTHGQLPLVQALLVRGAKPDREDIWPEEDSTDNLDHQPQVVTRIRTALIMATYNGHLQVVHALLQSGATPDFEEVKIERKRRIIRTALHIAAEQGDWGIATLLIGAKRESVNYLEVWQYRHRRDYYPWAEKWTALHTAMSLKRYQIVRLLLNNGAMVDTDNEGRYTTPHWVDSVEVGDHKNHLMRNETHILDRGQIPGAPRSFPWHSPEVAGYRLEPSYGEEYRQPAFGHRAADTPDDGGSEEDEDGSAEGNEEMLAEEENQGEGGQERDVEMGE